MEFQYCYLVHSDDELYHHGVKGMHWGIRRYQPYTVNPRKRGNSGVYKPKASSNEKVAKAEKWKQRESQRQASRYDRKGAVIDTYISKQKNKMKMAKINNASDKKIAKIQKKLDYGKMEKSINDKLKKAELNKIAKMKVDDVSSARLKKGAHYTAQVLKSTAVKATTAAALSGVFGAFKAAEKSAKIGEISSVYATKHWIAKGNARNAAENAVWSMAQNNRIGNKAGAALDFAAARAARQTAAEAGVRQASASAVASKAFATATAFKALGFGLGATTLGGAASSFTKIGRINEYSTLSRKERKAIINSVKNKKK